MNEQPNLNWHDWFITLILLASNIIGYILCVQIGEVVYNVGSMDAESVIIKHQYYRLFTAMFLHADINHIVSNMIFLVGIGQIVETAIGHLRFSILYLLSGLCGGALSIAKSVFSGELYSSVGASGAIFGLIGALFILVLIHNGNFRYISIKRILFAIVYMIYSGAGTQRVDNAAHIGGLVGGALIMSVLNCIQVFFAKREE